jgi:ferrous iron transport protein B
LLELPAYQVPLLRDVFCNAGLQSWWFIKRAGTIILLVNVVLWALMYYPHPEGEEGALETSYMSRIGRFFEPVSQYAGFDWRDNVALIGGAAAKEVVVSSMITMYEIEGDEEEDQDERLALRLRSEKGWSPFKAFAMLLFVMLYSPCVATCMVIWRETGHIKYMLAAIFYTNILAFFLAVVVYQIGNFLM